MNKKLFFVCSLMLIMASIFAQISEDVSTKINTLVLDNNYTEAENYISNLLLADENNISYLLIRARIRVNVGQYASAISDYTTILTLQPITAVAFFERGYVYRLNNKFAEALKDFNDAIQLDNTQDAFYFNRAFAKDKLNDKSGAKDDYTISINLNNSNPEAFYNRGFLNAESTLYSEAITDYTSAINLDPTYSKAYNGRAIAYDKINAIPSAEQDYLN